MDTIVRWGLCQECVGPSPYSNVSELQSDEWVWGCLPSEFQDEHLCQSEPPEEMFLPTIHGKNQYLPSAAGVLRRESVYLENTPQSQCFCTMKKNKLK